MTDLPASRRQVIAGLAALPVVAAPVVAMAASPAAGEGLAEAVARYRAAVANADAFDRDHLDPALAACRAACDAIPHFTTKNAYVCPKTGERKTLTTANEPILRHAKIITRIRKERGDDYVDPVEQELLDGDAVRERRKAELAAKYDIERLGDRSDEMWGMAQSIFRELEAYPVRTVEGLVTKYRALAEIDDTFEMEAASFLEDIERVTAQIRRAGL